MIFRLRSIQETLKILSILLLTFAVIALTRCSKKNETTVDVVVLEKGTNIPAVGIPVNFGYSSTGGVFSSQVVEQTKTTDANGRVSFKGQQNDETYGVGFPNGIDYFGDGTNLEQGKNGTIFLNTYPFAYVRVHAKNTSPYDSNDWIGLSGGLLGGGGSLYGTTIDTVIISGPFRGGESNDFLWDVKKNNILTSFSASLSFIGRDTIDYSINY